MSRYGDVPLFWSAPVFLGTFLGYSRIFGYHFLVKFDFFTNNRSRFLGTDFYILLMTFWNAACMGLVSFFFSQI